MAQSLPKGLLCRSAIVGSQEVGEEDGARVTASCSRGRESVRLAGRCSFADARSKVKRVDQARACGYFRSGRRTGTCGEVLITRGLPSAWFWVLMSASRYRKNFSASMAIFLPRQLQ